ncbi:MAG: DsbA family protein [Terriglobales bacterium]
MLFFKRSFVALLLLCLGCSAQSNTPTDLERRIERQIRAYYQIPEQVKIKAGPRQASEFPEYDKLTVTMSVGERKQDQEFLVSKDNKTLVRFAKMDLTKDPYAELMNKINIEGRPWRGKQDAKVVIVNYDDFQCPFCTRMHDVLFKDVFKEYADKIKIVYKDFPLYQIHPWANRAAVNSGCLAAQSNDAYWAFADYLHGSGREISGDKRPVAEQFEAVDKAAREYGQKFNVNAEKLNACLKAQDDSAVRASVREAEQVGVNATPTMFINGYKLDGAVPPEELKAAINRALLDAGETAPPNAPSASAQPAR